MTDSFRNFEMAKCILMERMPYFYHWTGLMTYGEVDGNASIPMMAAVPDMKAGTFKILANPALLRVVTTKGIIMAIAKCIVEIIQGAYKDKIMEHPLGGIARDLETIERLMADGFKMAEHPEFPGESLFVTIDLTMKYVQEIWAKLDEPDKQIDRPKERKAGEYYLNWLIDTLPTPAEIQKKQDELDKKRQDELDQMTDEEKEELEKAIEQMREAIEQLDLLKQRAAHPDVQMPPEKQALFDYLAAKQAQQAMVASNGMGMGSFGGEVKLLIESLKSRVNWRSMTRKFRGSAGHVKLTQSFARRNKYGGSPGTRHEQEASVMFVVDDSGSMGSRAVSQGVGEAEESGKHVDTTLIFIDDGDLIMDNVYTHFKKRKDRKVAATGGGGTDMRQIFYYIRDGKLKRPDVVIVFSDGYTPFPTKAERMGIRTLWVITNANIKVPREAGEVVYMPPEDQESDSSSVYAGY